MNPDKENHFFDCGGADSEFVLWTGEIAFNLRLDDIKSLSGRDCHDTKVFFQGTKQCSVLYNPDNPTVVNDGGSIGLCLMIAGAVILAVIAFSAIKEKQS